MGGRIKRERWIGEQRTLLNCFRGRKRHDSRMLTISGLFHWLQQQSLHLIVVCYFSLVFQLITWQFTYRGHTGIIVNNPKKEIWNSANTIRISVEWVFDDILCHWKYLDLTKNLNVIEQYIAKHFLVAVLLRSEFTCSFSCFISTYFYIQPPEVEGHFNVK